MKKPKIPALTLRPAKREDSATIIELVNAASLETLGTKWVLLDPGGDLRFARYVPPDAEKIVATTAEARAVAFAYLAAGPPYIAAEIGLYVHPDYQGAGLESRLLAWAEDRAREMLPLAPPEARVVLQCNLFDRELTGQTLLAGAGYHLIREWAHLEITMAEPPPPPSPPEGIILRQMDQGRDWPAVGAALSEAFADHWGQLRQVAETEAEAEESIKASEAEEEIEDNPYFNSRNFCFVAMDGETAAGSCLGNAKTVEWPESGKVGSLSVRRPYRRRGIARALLLHALGEFYRHGIRRVVTDTDSRSFTGANYLYQQVGMTIFRRECLYEKEIRVGQELRLLSPDELS